MVWLWLVGCAWISDEDVESRLSDWSPSDSEDTNPRDTGRPILVSRTIECVEKSCFIDVAAGNGVVCAARGLDGAVCWTDTEVVELEHDLDSVDIDGTTVCGTDRFASAPRCVNLGEGPELSPPSGLLGQGQTVVGTGWACSSASTTISCWGEPPFVVDSVDTSTMEYISGRGELLCVAGYAESFQARCYGPGSWEPAPIFEETVTVSAGSATYGVVGTSSLGSLERWRGGDLTPAQVVTGRFVQASASSSHACGLEDDGALTCIGAWEQSQGHEDAPDVSWGAIEAGDGYSCGLSIDGELHCWGERVPAAFPE